MNKIEIEIPNNKEIDWKESAKQEKIVFKKKQLTYEEISNALFEKKDNYFITSFGQILPNIDCVKKDFPNIAASKHQLQCLLAKNKLANVARYLNGEWKWNLGSYNAFLIMDKSYKENTICLDICQYTCYPERANVLFKSKEAALQAIEILGEETVKLALEPLY